jgi:hypothetical protein
VASNDPQLLWSLLDAIPEELNKVSTNTIDDATGIAARARELSFDEIIDPIFQHMNQYYRDPTQAFEVWGRYRRRLREELDALGTWASELLIASYVILAGLSHADLDIDRRAG